MSDHLYAYGVIEQADVELDVEAVAGADRVYTVDYRNLSAVVSDIDTTDPERTDEDVERHDDVLRAVMDHGDGHTVVPMSFGMAFKSARTLKGVVRGARRAFRKALNDVDGGIELGVKVVAPRMEPTARPQTTFKTGSPNAPSKNRKRPLQRPIARE